MSKNNCDSVPVCGHHLGFILLSPSSLGKPSAWCVRLFQGPKELCGRERYMDGQRGREGGRWSDHRRSDAHTERAEKMNVSERYSREKKRKRH